MSFKVGFQDLKRFLASFGHDDFTCSVVADYLDECIDFEMDLSYYVWNTLLFNVFCFETKQEALDYLDENYETKDFIEDYTLYECKDFKGVYLEVY